MDIATQNGIKKSFRAAYDFMEKHIGCVSERGQCKALAGDLAEFFAENMNDPLACRLVSGVYDFITAESWRMKNDSTGITG